MPEYLSKTPPVSYVFKQRIYICMWHSQKLVGILGARAGWWVALTGAGEAPQLSSDSTGRLTSVTHLQGTMVGHRAPVPKARSGRSQ